MKNYGAQKEFTMLPGKGIRAVVNEKQVFAGNTTLLQEQGIVLSNKLLSEAENYLENGSTVIYVAVDGAAMGFLVLSDTLRPESVGMIDAICEIGVQPVLLTGDHANAAHAIAQKLHISEVHADCLPEDKLAYIDDCQQNAGAVCMIGDGINDAPALKKIKCRNCNGRNWKRYCSRRSGYCIGGRQSRRIAAFACFIQTDDDNHQIKPDIFHDIKFLQQLHWRLPEF